MKPIEPSMSPLLNRLRSLFQDREYRHAYAESFTNTLLAAQLKVNREARNLSQAQLAALADMKQSRISTIENVNYESWSIRTLRRIARAMDLVLVVKLESFSSVVRDMESFNRESLERPSFAGDPAFLSGGQGQVLSFPDRMRDYMGAPAGTGVKLGAASNRVPDVTREFGARRG